MLKEIEVKTKQLLSDAIGDNTDLGYYRVQKIIKNRNVKINGVRVGSDMNVNVGDIVYVYLADREKNSVEVVYRDDNILVVSKSSGIEVTGEDSLTERINNVLTDAVAVPVHRLDRNTMGLVVFALNKTAENELLESFKIREIDKTYHCVVVGSPKQQSAKLKAYLFKDAKKSLVYISETQKQGYLPIETHYQLVKKLNPELSLLEVKPITGRTHQIRAQLASIRLPMLGDGQYGVNKINRKYRVKTQLLCCTKITFHFKQGTLIYLDGKSVVLGVDLTQYYKK
ncbi:MAG: RluA family pseudouridine synthase [Clostridia bacterium]|nr:RluA family pseudouridine synthase [Clostridia bacterium]